MENQSKIKKEKVAGLESSIFSDQDSRPGLICRDQILSVLLEFPRSSIPGFMHIARKIFKIQDSNNQSFLNAK